MTVKSILLFTLLLSILLLIACKSPKETDDPATLVKEMELQMNPCFGKCPFYTMTIYKGGVVRYDGKKYVKKFGLYTKKLSKSDYKSIKKAFKALDFWSFEDSYTSGLSDVPRNRLTLFENGKTKSIVGDMKRPKAILDLEAKMQAIANQEDGWTMRSVPNPTFKDIYITNELIISLRPTVDSKTWVKKYADWKMEIVKPITERRNLWLFKYDNPDLNPAQVINLLSIDEDVMILEFNKKTENTGQKGKE